MDVFFLEENSGEETVSKGIADGIETDTTRRRKVSRIFSVEHGIGSAMKQLYCTLAGRDGHDDWNQSDHHCLVSLHLVVA
jgi:hypothetical protein